MALIAEPLSTADHALLRALAAWGGDEVDRSLSRLSPDLRARVAGAWPHSSRTTPEDAWDALRRDHAASCRPDPARVHPSWYVRALQAESPAVRRVVAAHAPRAIRAAVQREFAFEPADLATDRPPDPEALSWALTLWTERLVGDISRRPDDPPVILALTSLPARELARLVKVAGLVKHAFAIEGPRLSDEDLDLARLTALDRLRLAYFRRHVGQADPRLVPIARDDLGAMAGDRRRGHARLGLLTFGRLLAAAEPHRARWALQHIPYPIARLIREKATQPIPLKPLASWEDWVLEAAWTRLLVEGRLIGARGGHA